MKQSSDVDNEDVMVEDKEEEQNQQNIIQVSKEANLSPQTLSKDRKGKNKGENSTKPTMVVPKRGVK